YDEVKEMECTNAEKSNRVPLPNSFVEERCAESLCNSETPTNCYVGEYGDCSWTETQFPQKECTDEDKIDCVWKTTPFVTLCDLSVRDICIYQKWIHPKDFQRLCHKYRCQHDRQNHGYELVYKNPKKENRSFEDKIENITVIVSQCKGNLCFKPNWTTHTCYESNTAAAAGLGNIVQCEDFATHCRLFFDSESREVTGRECTPPREAYTEWTELEDGIYFRDFFGNNSNDGPKSSYCYTGSNGTCKNLDGDYRLIWNNYRYRPYPTLCSNFDKECYATILPTDDGNCVIHTCDYTVFGDNV
uniref:Uncharacterized protein n=1 Tax=Panagrolaimus sp. JU765 TaxID=591449 RepID=A0AC34R6B1_9BILA